MSNAINKQATVVGLQLTTLGDGGRGVAASIALFIKVDGRCDKQATIVGQLLTTLGVPWLIFPSPASGKYPYF